MFFKYFTHFVLIITITILDIGFVGKLPFGLDKIHLFPIVLIFVAMLGNIRYSAWWVTIGGFILELFSFGIYGFQFFALILSILIIYILLEKVITNRSLYSIGAVTIASVFIYDTVLLLHDYMRGVTDNIIWKNILSQEILILVYSAIIAIILFYIINSVTTRLRPVFLSEKGYKI